jgi:hypothetical protein
MSLRFQEHDDEVDREAARETKRILWFTVIVLAFYAAIFGLLDWLNGQSLKSYEVGIGVTVAFGCVPLLVHFIIGEIRIRVKEIDGKVSAIESTVNESKEFHIELLEKLTAIKNRLDEIQDGR